MARAVGDWCFWVDVNGVPVIVPEFLVGIARLTAVDAPSTAVQPQVGERWRFVAPGRADEVVEILDTGYPGYIGFITADHTRVLIHPDGRPAVGTLEQLPPPAPKAAPRPKQHDEISLDEWRHKIGKMRWP